MSVKSPIINLGEKSVTAVSDGYLKVDFEMLSNIDEDECIKIQRDKKINELNSVHINTFLVRQHGKNILIDSGAGGIKGWGGGLVNNLAKLGIEPKDIDAILLTHAHPDHIGGLLDAEGKVLFTNAELMISYDEFFYIEDDKNFAAVTDRVKGNFLLARSIFKNYKNSLRLISKGEVLPGIFSIELKGHTPGHMGYRIESGKNNLLIWGDIVHFPHIQLLKPNVSIAFDYDPQMASTTRSNILDIVSSERILVGGMHFCDKGFGYIEKFKSGYMIVDSK